MIPGSRIIPAVLGMLVLACFTGTAAAVSLGTDWQERPYDDAPFSGVRFSDDGTMVLATGDQVLLRSWDGSGKWGGRSGFVADMTGNADFVVDGVGSSIVLLDRNMKDNWSRTMGGQVRAVAISDNGSYVISADDQGYYIAWEKNGAFANRSTDDVAKRIEISPSGSYFVATTEAGLRIFKPNLGLIWSDNRTSSMDNYIRISQDGSTIITAGGNRVMSHTSTGETNWAVWPTTGEIIDISCNYDCSAIILGSQDGTVVALDRYGQTRWTYKAGQWINAVGISRYGTVIAAGGLDGTVYLLDRTGKALTRKKMDSGIQARSLAVSPDGTRIAVADQLKLYGLSVLGDAYPGVMETFTQPPLNPAKTLEVTMQQTPGPAEIPLTTEPITAAPTPQPTTQRSDAGFLPVIGAWAAVFITIRVIHQ